MPAPYYGNPEVFQLLNRNASGRSLTSDLDEEIELFDSIVRLKLEADLERIFESWPAPDNSQQNVISVLWLYAMTEEYQAQKGSTAKAGIGGYGQEKQTQYEKLLDEVASGKKFVPGAKRRASFSPTVQRYTTERFKLRDVPETRVIEDTLQRGLRM